MNIPTIIRIPPNPTNFVSIGNGVIIIAVNRLTIAIAKANIIAIKTVIKLRIIIAIPNAIGKPIGAAKIANKIINKVLLPLRLWFILSF